jgi:putative toxin-antitoxin system antitoxin component (TIGR02293 family)
MSPSTIEELLGGSKLLGQEIESEMDLYELGREGIPKKSLTRLAANLKISMRALSAILHVTERTLQRKRDFDILNQVLSEHVIQIAEVYARGTEVFDSVEDFQTWMNSTSKALGNRKPVELLASRFGAHMVLNEIGRIEYGVYS